MKKIHFQLKSVLSFTSILGILSASCAPIIPPGQEADPVLSQQLQTQTAGSPTVTGTPPTPTSTPDLQPRSIEVLLPSFSEQYNAYIDAQVSEFERQVANKYPGLQVNLSFAPNSSFRDIVATMIAAGSPPTVVALDYNGVLEFGQAGYIQPALEAAEFWNDFTTEAVTFNTVGGQVLAYPWQRYSCSPNHTNLVIFKDRPPREMEAARDLILFLINEPNQRSNLETSHLRAYPTRKMLYQGLAAPCPASTKIPLNPMLAQQTALSARLQSDRFSQIFQIQTNVTGVAGLDGSQVINDPNVLVAFVVPAANDQQRYQDRQVIGYITTISDRASLSIISLQGKGAVQESKLPPGSYLIACHPQTNNCLAVSETGQVSQLNPEKITVGIYSAASQATQGAFRPGSWGGCVTIAYVEYCIYIG